MDRLKEPGSRKGFRKTIRLGLLCVGILGLGIGVAAAAGALVLTELNEIRTPADHAATQPLQTALVVNYSAPANPAQGVPAPIVAETVPPPLVAPAPEPAIRVQRALPVAEVPVRRAQPVRIAPVRAFDVRSELADTHLPGFRPGDLAW